ncbi:hypothetical protein ACFZCU_43570 [Streptomyces canus]
MEARRMVGALRAQLLEPGEHPAHAFVVDGEKACGAQAESSRRSVCHP